MAAAIRVDKNRVPKEQHRITEFDVQKIEISSMDDEVDYSNVTKTRQKKIQRRMTGKSPSFNRDTLKW